MDFTMKRHQLTGDLRLTGIVDERVLTAVRQVPRERFVPTARRHLTYTPLPVALGYGQVLMPVSFTATVFQALRLTGEERVLEIGTGSGYEAAVLGELVATVITVERLEPLATAAAGRLQELGCQRVQVQPAGPELGWAAGGPYDAIVVSAAAPAIPTSLFAQLAPGGRLIVPVGGRSQQQVMLVRPDDTGWTAAPVLGCAVVPLVGVGGWPDAPQREAPRPWC